MQKIFSYPIQIDKLTGAEKNFHLVADDEQKDWIAQIFQVESVRSFSADICVKSEKKGHIIKVFGKAEADIEQKSVISLENFVRKYESDFEIFYDTKATYAQIREEYEDINEDAPEVVENVAMEQIAVLLDDYPRQEGEIFEFVSEFDEETTKSNNPFAVLQKIKK